MQQLKPETSPNWPSPMTTEFAKHLAKHAGKNPDHITTHEEALEFIANRSNVCVETVLKWTIKHWQSFCEPWSVPGKPGSPPNSNAFHIKGC